MGKVVWEKAPDVKIKIKSLVKELELSSLDPLRVHCYRSRGSSANAYARIWGLPSVWQKALRVKPQYVLEVLSEKYDRLSEQKKMEVLIHEVSHIPSNFSGALVPHIRRGKRNFHKRVNDIIEKYFRNKNI